MRGKRYLCFTAVIALLVAGMPALADIGVFDKTADWGGPNSLPQVGTYKVAGSATYSGGVYTVKGNGDDIWNNNDEGFFVYKELSGNNSLSAKVHFTDQGGTNEWAKTGVMLREKGDVAGSRHYWVDLRAGTAGTGDRLDAQWRLIEGAASGNVEIQANGASIPDPGTGIWLRVSRISSVGLVFLEYSLDGTTWNLGNVQLISFANTVAYGLTTTNHEDNELLAASEFSDVKLSSDVGTAGCRVLSTGDPIYVIGEAITVSLTVGSGSSTFTVVETPPTGWTISNVSDGGTVSGGKITWNLSESKTVTYVVTPPTGATGNATFSGTAGTYAIGGTSSLNAPSPLGIFDNHVDIGDVAATGDASYDEATDEYEVIGSGADMWDTADEFHFVYKKVTGAFAIQGLVFGFNETSSNEWSKSGIMIRDNLSAGSPHLQGIFRCSDGQYDSQWRSTQDGSSSDTGLKSGVTGDVRLIRNGNTVSAYYMDGDGNWVLDTTQVLPLTDPVYVGLTITSHDDGNTSIGLFDETQLTLYPFEVSKEFSQSELTPGSMVDVTLNVNIRSGQTSNVTLKEAYSSAVTLSGMTASSGQATDDKKGNIAWTLSGATGLQTLKFTVNVPATYKDGFVSFQGTFDDGKGYTGSTGSNSLPVKTADLGIFQGHQDIGTTGATGNISYDGETWKVIGSGADIWGTADGFHFLWLRAKGDFKISVDSPYIGGYGNNPSTDGWQKMAVMARQDLTAGSQYAAAELRASDQDMFLQWRETSGGDAAGNDATMIGPDVWNDNYDPTSAGISNPSLDQLTLGGGVVLTREGNLFTMWYIYEGEEYYVDEHEVAMTDPIYVGVATTAHSAGKLSQGIFQNPKFEGTTVSVGKWMLY